MKKTAIRKELAALQAQAKDGILHVEAVHAWAKRSPRSALHSAIEWDIHKAAREYQYWQIRRIISLTVVSESGEPELVNLVIDRRKGGGYRAVADVLSDRALSKMMLGDALQELERVQLKYQRVKDLVEVWDAVGRVRKRSRPRDSKGTRASA